MENNSLKLPAPCGYQADTGRGGLRARQREEGLLKVGKKARIKVEEEAKDARLQKLDARLEDSNNDIKQVVGILQSSLGGGRKLDHDMKVSALKNLILVTDGDEKAAYKQQLKDLLIGVLQTDFTQPPPNLTQPPAGVTEPPADLTQSPTLSSTLPSPDLTRRPLLPRPLPLPNWATTHSGGLDMGYSNSLPPYDLTTPPPTEFAKRTSMFQYEVSSRTGMNYPSTRLGKQAQI